MLTLYEAIAKEHDDDPYARQQQALAYKRIALILQISGQNEESLTAVNKGISILEELLEASPSDKDLKLKLSELLFDRLHIVQVWPREGRLKDARRALALREEAEEMIGNEEG